jgi:membrane protease YdiL (CAAX protease family)
VREVERRGLVPVSSEVAASEEAPRRATWRIWGVDFDARIVQLVVVSTVLLIMAFNDRFVSAAYDRFFLEFLVPVALIIVLWRENPRRYGLAIGDWRLGLPVTIVGIAGMAVVIWFFSRQPDFQQYYTQDIAGRPSWRLIIDTCVDIFAWEFFCRGWLLWGLGRKYGSDAVWLQVIPFALMHMWKPQIEQLSTVIGGAFFGILAWRTGSILYGWLLHTFMVAWILLLAAGAV